MMSAFASRGMYMAKTSEGMGMNISANLKRRIWWLGLAAALTAAAGAGALLHSAAAATASVDTEPYSVSLHSPVTFPVDI